MANLSKTTQAVRRSPRLKICINDFHVIQDETSKAWAGSEALDTSTATPLFFQRRVQLSIMRGPKDTEFTSPSTRKAIRQSSIYFHMKNASYEHPTLCSGNNQLLKTYKNCPSFFSQHCESNFVYMWYVYGVFVRSAYRALLHGRMPPEFSNTFIWRSTVRGLKTKNEHRAYLLHDEVCQLIRLACALVLHGVVLVLAREEEQGGESGYVNLQTVKSCACFERGGGGGGRHGRQETGSSSGLTSRASWEVRQTAYMRDIGYRPQRC